MRKNKLNVSGTAALGKSVIDMRLRNRRLVTGKFIFSVSNLESIGYSLSGKRKSQKPKIHSPNLRNCLYAI